MTRDIELRYSQSGKAVAKGTVACQREYKNNEGKYDADFIDFVAFGKTAEFIAQNTRKGGRIEVVGRNQIDRYEGQDGITRYSHQVVVDSVSPIDWNNDNQGSGQGNTGGWTGGGGDPYGQNPPPNSQSYNSDPFAQGEKIDLKDDDLPF